jgi:NADH:ubiquinone oxidoreductase subunit 4 (subunit M)
MDLFMNNILNIVCYIPLAGMILIMLIKRESENAIRWVANITAFIGFLVSIPLLTSFNNPKFIGPNGFRFIFEHSWIPQIGAYY